MEIESAVGDYRDVGGVLLPHSFETSAKGAAQKQSLQFDKIELNVVIDDSRFQIPAAEKPMDRPEAAPTPATGRDASTETTPRNWSSVVG